MTDTEDGDTPSTGLWGALRPAQPFAMFFFEPQLDSSGEPVAGNRGEVEAVHYAVVIHIAWHGARRVRGAERASALLSRRTKWAEQVFVACLDAIAVCEIAWPFIYQSVACLDRHARLLGGTAVLGR